MDIISHRGFWNKDINKNSIKSFENSFKNNFGLETDVRDVNEVLKISHDMALDSNLDFETLLKLYSLKSNKYLALNIKSDGLHNEINILLKKYKVTNYFVFDMSIPDTLGYLKNEMNVFIRQSEYENNLPFYKDVKGIWLDSFKNIWYNKSTILNHLSNNKIIAIVSADLHQRDYLSHWRIIKEWGIDKLENIILCTDFPLKANNYFNN